MGFKEYLFFIYRIIDMRRGSTGQSLNRMIEIFLTLATHKSTCLKLSSNLLKCWALCLEPQHSENWNLQIIKSFVKLKPIVSHNAIGGQYPGSFTRKVNKIIIDQKCDTASYIRHCPQHYPKQCSNIKHNIGIMCFPWKLREMLPL